MPEEIISEEVINVNIIEGTLSLMDFLPYVISILSIIVSVIIVIIQYATSTRAHRNNNNFDEKREAIQEALDFLDLFISNVKTDSIFQAISEPITDAELTKAARRVHNKLCVTCKNKKIVNLFLEIVVPDKVPYNIFEYYDKFRNECRRELEFKKIVLPKDKIFIAVVSTKPLVPVVGNVHKQL